MVADTAFRAVETLVEWAVDSGAAMAVSAEPTVVTAVETAVIAETTVVTAVDTAVTGAAIMAGAVIMALIAVTAAVITVEAAGAIRSRDPALDSAIRRTTTATALMIMSTRTRITRILITTRLMDTRIRRPHITATDGLLLCLDLQVNFHLGAGCRTSLEFSSRCAFRSTARSADNRHRYSAH